jgi:CheY-like chemotaxis protein
MLVAVWTDPCPSCAYRYDSRERKTSRGDGARRARGLQDPAGGSEFTAAILDVVMPHISGPELVRYMKSEERLKRIPVMMMTAEQDPKLSSDSFSAGAIVFLPKPFTTAQLQIMLQMLIGKKTAE